MKLYVSGDSFVDRYGYDIKYGKYPLWPELVADWAELDLTMVGYSGCCNNVVFTKMAEMLFEDKDAIAICSWTSFDRITVKTDDVSRRLSELDLSKSDLYDELSNKGFFDRSEADYRNVHLMKSFELMCEKSFHVQGPWPWPWKKMGGHETFLKHDLRRPQIEGFYSIAEPYHMIGNGDGHPNEAGHLMLANEIYNLLEKHNAI